MLCDLTTLWSSYHISFVGSILISEKLHNLLTNRSDWVMSYNDCEEIREMYKGYEIHEAAWAYGMNKSKKSSEIIIIGR